MVALTDVKFRGTVITMKEIIIKINDELYDRAKETLADVESSVEAHVTSYLEGLNGDETHINAARARMKDLFDTTKGFGVGEKPSREEMHERRRLY